MMQKYSQLIIGLLAGLLVGIFCGKMMFTANPVVQHSISTNSNTHFQEKRNIENKQSTNSSNTENN